MAGMVADGITIKFSANTSGLTGGAKQAQDVIGGFAKVAGVALLATGAAALAAGVAATKMAGDFQAGMTSLVTGAGESAKNIKMVSAGILDMATQTGTSTKQLTDGMYMIESAGFHGAAGLEVLKNAAEGAKVGNADLKDVANGVTTALTDYSLPASKAAAVTNDLIATVANGKTTMGALSSSLKDILPVASSAGISLGDVSAAMATMTGEGVPAAQAATYLRQTVLALEAPSSKGADALKSIGLTSQQVSDAMKKSLPDALQMITDNLKKKFPEGSAAYISALKDISGGSKTMMGMLDLTGDHLKTFKDNVTNISGAVKSGGSSIAGWSDVQQNFNFKMDQAREVVETLGIKLGTKLLPMVGQLLDRVMPAITAFGDWLISSGALENGFNMLVGAISGVVNVVSTVVGFFQQNHTALVILQASLGPIIGIIGGALVFAFVAWATAAWSAAAATLAATWPFLLIGALIGAVVVGIILAIQHWGAITKWFQGIWGAVSNWFMGIVKAVGSFFMGIWSTLAAWFTGMWTGIITGLMAAWNFILNVVRAAGALLLAIVLGPIYLIANAFIWLYNHNYYFKALVDSIIGFFQMLFSWLVDGWNNFIKGLVITWNNLIGFAAMIWTQVAGAIQNGFIIAVDFVEDIWTSISTIFSNAWNTYVAGPVSSFWTAFSNVVSNAWSTYISGPLLGFWNSFVNTANGWAAAATNWGVNLIQGFINGITSMLSNVGNAAGQIVGKISALLGFHSPTKEGPGSEADVWAPNFVKMYAKGLTDGLPQIQNAVNKLSTPLALNFNSKFQYPTAAATSSPQVVVHVHNAAPDIYMDTDKVTEHVAKKMAGKMRLKGDIRAR